MDYDLLVYDPPYETVVDSPKRYYAVVFWIVFGITLVISGGLYYLDQKVIAIIPVGICLAVSILIAPQIGFYLYFAWQAFDATLVSSETAVFTPAKALSLFIVFVYIISLYRIRTKVIASKGFLWLMLGFAFLGIIASAWAIAPLASLRYSLQVLVQIILVLATLHFIDTEMRIRRLLFWCFIGGVLAAIIMIVTGGISSQYSRGTLGEYANPNTTAAALSVSLVSLPGLILLTKSKWHRVFYVAASVLILAAMMKTGSRSNLIAIIAGFMAGAMFGRSSGVVKRILFPIMTLILIIGVWHFVVSANLLDEKSQEHLGQIFSGSLEDRGARSRTNIWGQALEVFLQHGRMIGFGFGNTAFAMDRYKTLFIDIHNTFLSSLMDGGIIGFGLFMTALGWMFLRIWQMKDAKKNIVTMMVFLYLMVNSLTHTLHFTKWFWIPITICLLFIETDAKDSFQNNDELNGYAND